MPAWVRFSSGLRLFIEMERYPNIRSTLNRVDELYDHDMFKFPDP